MTEVGIKIGEFSVVFSMGKWTEVIIHTKFASAANNDGVVEVWKNGKLEHGVYNVRNHSSTGPNGVDKGYLLGWANTGFQNTTIIYIDDCVFSNTRIVSQYNADSQPMPPTILSKAP